MISLAKLKILTPLQKLHELLPQALKRCPKSNNSPNLVTLTMTFDNSITCVNKLLNCKCSSESDLSSSVICLTMNQALCHETMTPINCT